MKTKRYGDILRECRTAAGLSQTDLTVRAGVGKCAVWYYESGRQMPSAAAFEKLINGCGYEMRIVKKGKSWDR